MKKQFVTYEIALRLKELGFDEECICRYNSYGALKHCISGTNPDIDDYISFNKYDDRLLAPLYQQVIDWFREKHNIDIIIKPWSGDKVGEKTYAADVFIFGTITYIKLKREGTYEEARDQAILKCIELCQNKK